MINIEKLKAEVQVEEEVIEKEAFNLFCKDRIRKVLEAESIQRKSYEVHKNKTKELLTIDNLKKEFDNYDPSLCTPIREVYIKKIREKTTR